MGHFYWEVYMGVLVGLIAAFGTCWGLTDPRDVVAINNLYAALGSPPLPGWVPTGGDPCAEGWQGVLCVNANITGIVLNGANLGVYWARAWGLCFYHTNFSSGNQFTGSIPETFSSLGQLTDMSLSNNHLTGVIPDTFQQLTGLINLDLSGNNLDGQLPPSMGSLSSLTTLHLQDNRLVGTLDILQDLPLIDLNIENNLFSGPVPRSCWLFPLSGDGKQKSIFIHGLFLRSGNPFNTTVLPSPPASPPSPSPSPTPFGALPPKQVPRIRPDEPSAPENTHSSKGQNFLSKRVVLIAIVALVIVIVLALGLCLFMSRYCKGRPLTNKVPERHGMDEDDYPRDNPKHNMSLLKPYSRTENAQKEAEQEREVAAVPKHKEDHNIDMPEMDENILPPPPLPALLNPFERVTARPNVAPVTFKKQISEKLSSARTFSIASLQQYTQSFSQENLLGGGMLGTVYRAELPDGKLLAVKKLDVAASRHLSDGDFLEFVSRISKLQHVNIVQFVGFCAEHGQRLLVYEYCGNGTVYEALHIDDEIHKNLSWNARIRLALQAARALEYLHEVCQPPIVHRNFKSANVLLDDGFAVRVSDCGLLPLISSNYITQFQGSGYGAPELEMGSYTCQSDVYSFGVVMLELFTGRKSYDRSRFRGEQFLVRWATPQLHDIDALSRMVDPSLKGAYPSKSLSRLADIISLCVQTEPEFRPPMSEIVEGLLHMVVEI